MIREDETAAQAFGVDVTRTKLVAFVIAGATAGLAGAAYGSAIGLVNSDVFPLDLSLRIVLFVDHRRHRPPLGRRDRRGPAVARPRAAAVPPRLGPRGGRRRRALQRGRACPGGLAGLVSELFEVRRRFAPTGRPSATDEDDEHPCCPTWPPSCPLPHRARPADGQPVLRVQELSVQLRWAAGPRRGVARGATAEIVGIIGPNGAGKSTLFNAISGFAPTLRWPGVPRRPAHPRAASAPARAARVGRTFQHVGLARDMSVRENILLAQHRTAAYGDVAALLLHPPASTRSSGRWPTWPTGSSPDLVSTSTTPTSSSADCPGASSAWSSWRRCSPPTPRC